MDYQIIFLGVGSGDAVLRQLRAAGGIVFRFGNKQFHVDPGVGALIKAREFGVNLKENSVILASHKHLAHCNDLNLVVDVMTLGNEKKGSLITAESLTKENLHREKLNEFFSLEEGQSFNFDDIEVKALKTFHSDETCIGFKFTTNDLVITYSSDTSYSPDLIKQYKYSDILILNNVYPFNSEKRDNLSSEDSVKIIKNIRPKLGIIQHYGSKMLEANPLYEAREIQGQTGTEIIAAKEGLVINPISEGGAIKQKKLSQY